MSDLERDDRGESADIAIIGMAGRFPGAAGIEDFWRNLTAGVESITALSDAQLEAAGVSAALRAHPDYVRSAATLDGIDRFDPLFFGLTPRDAELIDPQHRVFLECAWEALENAGYEPDACPSTVGVYAGTSINTYLLHNLLSRRETLKSADLFQALIGNDKDFLATRVAYKLNLKGPSLTVQTACSTSLVAVCLACQSLLTYQCDTALAGGVTIKVPQEAGYLYQEGGLWSPDGHCRAFDAEARGTVFGSGVGIVVLKRLADALADGDRIDAVIKGTAINNDGARKINYTAPSMDGQAEVIATAHAVAGVTPDSIAYVEAHGTGTPRGDPIEIAALRQVFGAATQRTGFCAIGAVKTNVGHLEAAAGVTGLIKTVLMLRDGLIPPTVHFERPNPLCEFENGPFYVNRTLAEWPRAGSPRRAAVSSFGIGGTNAHVVLEEPPRRLPTDPTRKWQLLVLSAKTRTALDTASANLATHLREHPDVSLADVAYTLQTGRKSFAHRRMLVCQDRDEALAALTTLDPKQVASAVQPGPRPVAFMFPGQGVQYVDMTRGLYELEPAFRAHLDQCAELLAPHLGVDLRALLYAGAADAEAAAARLAETAVTQPALFAVEYALAQLWIDWGIRPRAMIGHSLGEYVAACVAGVFSLADGARIVAARGRLMQELPAGAMLAVAAPQAAVEGLLGSDLAIAALNGPALCVVSGPCGAIARLETRLSRDGTSSQRLVTSHAFHSPMMEPMLAAFTDVLASVELRPPRLPYVSNVTGTWITAAEATDPHYWARHLRCPVRFAAGLATLADDPDQVLLDVGPGQTLRAIAAQCQQAAAPRVILAAARHRDDPVGDLPHAVRTLGKLWLAGVAVEWSRFHARDRRARVPLPTYPFERVRCWIAPRQADVESDRDAGSLHKRSDIADWFYVPTWKRSAPPELLERIALPEQPACLVLGDDSDWCTALTDRLRAHGLDVVTVVAGASLARCRERAYAIDPQRPSDYTALLTDLDARGIALHLVVHLWNADRGRHVRVGGVATDDVLARAFDSLVFLAQAIGSGRRTAPLHLRVISDGMQAVTGEEMLAPAKAVLLGPCRVISQEYAGVTCRSIDIDVPAPGSSADIALIDRLAIECMAASADAAVAYRRGERWAQCHDAVRLERAAMATTRLRDRGVYLITGGLGGIGLSLARHLAERAQARLILLGRSPFPAQQEWDEWLAAHDDEDVVSGKIRALQELVRLGADVVVMRADVADRARMEEVRDEILGRFGALHGVIHAAGIPGQGMIQRKTREHAASTMAPKVTGTLVLDVVFGDCELDFLVLCSSLGALLGGFGQVDYCAANAFLDAFAQTARRAGTTATVSVNWGMWLEVGMAADARRSGAFAEIAGNFLEGLSPAEGGEAFDRILGAGRALSQVAVSPQPLPALIATALATAGAPLLGGLAQRPHDAAVHERPELQTPYVPPRNELERRLAAIWCSILGIDGVGIHDNFFELSGNSLLAVQVISAIRDTFAVDVPVGIFFGEPTIADLASEVSRLRGEEPAADDPHGLLARIDELSDAEVASILGDLLQSRTTASMEA